ncbi:MAG: hypothetical protein ACM3SP_05690, partial [Chloroflexota bacterium]
SRVPHVNSFVGRVELWHLAIVLLLSTIASMTRWLDSIAVLAGGLFMGVNFLLLSVGIRWLLSSQASPKRRRLGMLLLLFKLLFFLGLLAVVFYRLKIDGVSFVAGITCLLVASVAATFSVKEDRYRLA